MKWEFTTPKSGDMVRVKVGSVYHYGVFVSEEEVIQFGFAPIARQTQKDSEIEVCSADVDAFLCGGFLEVATLDKKEQKQRRKPKETVEISRSRLGEKGYNILYNNCEHFAYECVMGEKKCTQADAIRNLFRKMPIADVFVAKIPAEMGNETLYPAERNDEVQACSHEGVKRQKYYAWKLLEYALERTFAFKIRNLSFTKTKQGKWTVPNCFFSISHSENAVAVAVSRDEIGVDVERIASPKNGYIKKVLTKAENAQFSELPIEEQTQFLIGKWTEKESIFKRENLPAFRPAKINVADYSVTSKPVEVDGEGYMLAVATEHLTNVRYYLDVQLNG